MTGAEVKKLADRSVTTKFPRLWHSGFRIIVAGALAWQKFYQQESVREFILDHIVHMFVEASPSDDYFGCKQDLKSVHCYFPTSYRGENVLGLLYTEIALYFTELGPQEFVDAQGNLLIGEALQQRKQIVRQRMEEAVSNYRIGKLHPPYFDLSGEPHLPPFVLDPQIGDARVCPGTGTIIPVAPYQLGVNWRNKPVEASDEYFRLVIQPQDRYYPAGLLIRRRFNLNASKLSRRLYENRRLRTPTTPWAPALMGRYDIPYWGYPVERVPDIVYPAKEPSYRAWRRHPGRLPRRGYAPQPPPLQER